MGNKQQSQVQTKENMQQNNLKLSIKHPKLSKSKLIQSNIQSQPSYLQITQPIQSKQIYLRWKQGISKYTTNQKQNISQIETILLPKILQFQEKGLCGTSGVVKSKYLFVPYGLKQQIENRKTIKQPFLQKQLWYLMYILTLAGTQTHSKLLLLGDIRPQNVLMSSDGEICVVCLQSFLDQEKNYFKSLYQNKVTYLAPEQVQNLKENKSQPTVDQFASQNFSIGLTVLSAIMLKDYSYLYTNSTQHTTQNQKPQKIQSFNIQSLHSQLSKLKSAPYTKQYSPNLRKITQSLLQINPKLRLTCQQVIQILKEFQEQIVNLDDFVIEDQKIQKSIREKLEVSSSNGGEGYKKVINNSDYNKNSRIQYSHSPLNSARGTQNNQNLFGSKLGTQRNQSQFYKQVRTANVVPRSQLNSVNVSESYYIQHPANLPATNVIPPANPSLVYSESQSIPLSNLSNSSYIVQQHPPRNIYVNRPQSIAIQQKPLYGSSMVVSPEVTSYASQMNSYIPHQYNENRNVQNQVRAQSGYTEQQFQANKNSRQPLYFQHPNQPRVYNPPVLTSQYYNPNNLNQVPSYKPFQPHMNANVNANTSNINNNNNNNSLNNNNNTYTNTNTYTYTYKPSNQNQNHPTQPVRQSTTIRQFSDNLVVNKYDKSKDKIFETYDQVIKNIDQTLRQSKKHFPDVQ